MFPSSEPEARLVVDDYLSPDRATQKVGGGVNGIVFFTSRGSAVKVLALRQSFEKELMAYQRLDLLGIRAVCGFTVPHLIGHCDKRLVIEMSLVQRPFLLDFASCCIDIKPQQAYTQEWVDQYIERIEILHDERASKVFEVYNTLARMSGIYHTDLRPTNIGFQDEESA